MEPLFSLASTIAAIPGWRSCSATWRARRKTTSGPNSIRCWTNEIVNERYRFTNTRNSVMSIAATFPAKRQMTEEKITMKAIVVTDQAAGTAGMKLVERPEPQGAALASLSGANYGDVIVQVHASGFTGDELAWPSTWIDRLGRDRTPSIPGHELAGVATALSYGTTGLSVGQRVRRRLRRFPSCSRPATNHRW